MALDNVTTIDTALPERLERELVEALAHASDYTACQIKVLSSIALLNEGLKRRDARAALAIARLESIFGIAANIEDGTEGLDSTAEIKRLADEALTLLGKPAA